MIHTSIRINDSLAKCERCGNNFFLPQKGCEAKCIECGAFYKAVRRELTDTTIEFEYLFDGFRCIHRSYNTNCSNICPTADMFCKEHCTDDHIKSNRELAKNMEERAIAQHKLVEKLEESKKTWLVEELSGINESSPDQNSLSNDKTP